MSMDNDSAMKSGLLNSGLLILAAVLSGVSLSIMTFETGKFLLLIYSLASYVVLIFLQNKLSVGVYLVSAVFMLALDSYTLYSMRFSQGGGSTAALVLFYVPTIKLLILPPIALLATKLLNVIKHGYGEYRR